MLRRKRFDQKQLDDLVRQIQNDGDEVTEREFKRGLKQMEVEHRKMLERNMIILRKTVRSRFRKKEIISRLGVMSWDEVTSTSIDQITSELDIEADIFDDWFVKSFLKNLQENQANGASETTTSELTWSSYSNYYKYKDRPKKPPSNTLF